MPQQQPMIYQNGCRNRIHFCSGEGQSHEEPGIFLSTALPLPLLRHRQAECHPAVAAIHVPVSWTRRNGPDHGHEAAAPLDVLPRSAIYLSIELKLENFPELWLCVRVCKKILLMM